MRSKLTIDVNYRRLEISINLNHFQFTLIITLIIVKTYQVYRYYEHRNRRFIIFLNKMF